MSNKNTLIENLAALTIYIEKHIKAYDEMDTRDAQGTWDGDQYSDFIAELQEERDRLIAQIEAEG